MHRLILSFKEDLIAWLNGYKADIIAEIHSALQSIHDEIEGNKILWNDTKKEG